MTDNIVAISSVYHKGMTHVPSSIRRFLGIEDGDSILYLQDPEGRIYIEKGRRLRMSRRERTNR